MKIDTEQIYSLKVKADHSYELKRNNERCTFAKPATIRGISKLYTISQGSHLYYVGIARAPMSSRINSGLKSSGKNGYHGYKWKHIRSTMDLRVWTISKNNKLIEFSVMEAIEAEVAYMCRQESKQWPRHQQEIHFHQSKSDHRKIAKIIYAKSVV